MLNIDRCYGFFMPRCGNILAKVLVVPAFDNKPITKLAFTARTTALRTASNGTI
jgi:hypothetical protein